MTDHTLTYVETDGTESVELSFLHDSTGYTVSLARRPGHILPPQSNEGGPELTFVTTGVGTTQLVAHKPAQRFNNRAWTLFINEHRTAWEDGDLEDFLG